MTAAEVGVIAHEYVAGAPVVGLEVLQSITHQQRRYEQQLGSTDGHRCKAAMRVENAAVALVGLVDDRRGGGAPQVRRRFEAYCLEGTSNDSGSHRIDRDAGWEWRTLCGQLSVQLERHRGDPRAGTTRLLQAF